MKELEKLYTYIVKPTINLYPTIPRKNAYLFHVNLLATWRFMRIAMQLLFHGNSCLHKAFKLKNNKNVFTVCFWSSSAFSLWIPICDNIVISTVSLCLSLMANY